ncbi:hypothetical protein CEN49_25020 [Fischerella thermalis CCMEE 5273]|nr:hypothetical protein CEN49_25020 [Fischerella thermalis CCMEE 5273]
MDMSGDFGLVAIGFLAGIIVFALLQKLLQRGQSNDEQTKREHDKERILSFLRDWDRGSLLTTRHIAQAAFPTPADVHEVFERLMELREEGQVKVVASKLDTPLTTGWVYIGKNGWKRVS